MESRGGRPNRNRTDPSPLLFFIIVGIVIASIAAFVILKP
jgi:hypothetical protein